MTMKAVLVRQNALYAYWRPSLVWLLIWNCDWNWVVFFFFFRFLFFGCCVKSNLNMLIYWMEESWETRDPYVGTGRGKIGTEKVVNFCQNSFGSWFQRDVTLFKFDAVWRKRAAVLYHVIFTFVIPRQLLFDLLFEQPTIKLSANNNHTFVFSVVVPALALRIIVT